MANQDYPPEFYTDLYSYFDNEWLCPYCARPTQPQHRSCPACRQPLILRKRLKEERTVWLWRGIILQMIVIFLLLAAGSTYVTLAVKWNGIATPVPFLPVYFGRHIDQPAEAIDTVLRVFPRWAFWGVVAAILYSFAMIVMLYIRLPYGHFIYLISSCVMFILGISGILLFHESRIALPVSVLVIFLGLGQFLVTLNLWNDFTFQESRLRLRIDRGAKNHQSLFISGRKYSNLGMWGLAVIHLRRAVSRKADVPAYHLALATAYMNIERYDLADESLANAENLVGREGEVLRLRKRLSALIKPRNPRVRR